MSYIKFDNILRHLQVFFLALLLPFFLSSQERVNIIDSIINYRTEANNRDISINERFTYARKAIELSKIENNDTTVLASNRVLSYLFLVNQNFDSIYRINTENLLLAKKIKDTLKMGFASQNIGFYFNVNKKNDSAYYYYYNAKEYYKQSKRLMLEVDVLRNMSLIQEEERDFIGAEINAVNAIKILDGEPDSQDKYDNLWSLNNSLANISSKLNNFERGIEYHSKALNYANKIKDNYSLNLYSRINIAILYKRKKDYIKAKELFLDLINDPAIKIKDLGSYATVLSDLAHTKLLNGENDFLKQKKYLWKALKILVSVEDPIQVVSASEHLSELYIKTEIKDSALYYANKMYDKAKEISANQFILNSLLLKSKIEEGEASKKHLYDHIKINDSLIQAERSISNKFARINYETDTIIEEKEQASRLNQWLFFISGGLLLSLFFLYIIKTQREKNKELQLVQQQQEANEEIYKLMLTQQDRQDEARMLEKKRISQELHDGVLGRLFGARLSLDSLNLSTKPDAPKNRETYINELKNIEQDIRKVSHDLNTDFIQKSGFEDIVRALVETQTTAYGLDFEFNADQSINWNAIDNRMKVHLYRIIQESMQNTYKHAQASKIIINFREDGKNIELSIIDDGKGFNTSKSKKGIGIKNMDSRVKEINGNLGIESDVDNGTTIKIHVPA